MTGWNGVLKNNLKKEKCYSVNDAFGPELIPPSDIYSEETHAYCYFCSFRIYTSSSREEKRRKRLESDALGVIVVVVSIHVEGWWRLGMMQPGVDIYGYNANFYHGIYLMHLKADVPFSIYLRHLMLITGRDRPWDVILVKRIIYCPKTN